MKSGKTCRSLSTGSRIKVEIRTFTVGTHLNNVLNIDQHLITSILFEFYELCHLNNVFSRTLRSCDISD